MFSYYYYILLSNFNLFWIQRESKKPIIGKEYFNHMKLEAIVKNYPYRKGLSKEDVIKGQLL